MSTKKAASRENVRVVARIRPTNQKEISNGGVECVKYNNETIDINGDDGNHTFSFDQIFGMNSTQAEVFEYTAVPLIQDVLNGYNATIFAYGQTGTGKTHTMEGDINDPDLRGIIPRAVEKLFDGVMEADENIEFTFKVSYVEIYMEKIRDLLDDNHTKNNLTVREDKIKGIYIAGVTEEYVTSDEELLSIMAAGATNRATAATGMNEGSSRSHSVFTITVTQRDLNTNTTKSGKLVLVDLAGSEMVRKSNATGQQLEEAKTINKSLSALGQVINALTDEKQTHVPYRDSKLTRVLQDSLGGNAKTVLIVAVSPSSFNANETVSTLRFGMRAKNIENKVTVNQTRSVEELENLLIRAEKAIDAQTAHIVSLDAQLQALQLAQAQSNSGGGTNSAAAAAALAAAEAARAEANGVIKSLQEIVAQLTQELEEERIESGRKDTEITALTQLLKDKERLLQEAGELLQEAQRHYEGQRERSEQLVREKAQTAGELEGLRQQVNEELERAKFEMKELEVTVETLRQENKQLQEEIAEMSGDSAVERTGASPVKAKGDNRNRGDNRSENQGIQFGGDEDFEATSQITMNTGFNDSINLDAPLNSSERNVQMQDMLSHLGSLCHAHGISGEATADLVTLMKQQAATFEASSLAFEAKLQQSDRASSEQLRRIRDMEVQRSRLERDLAGRIEKLVKLQFEMDTLRGMDGINASEYLAERERAHMRSLQQRLEQLVVVHRQLLRKFASLELENGEFRKKIMLRDERIKQLESNSRGLTGNMRQQAERHVAELTNLREQIQLLRAEHQQRMENKETPTIPRHGGDGRRVVRGGATTVGMEAPKSVRGGKHAGGFNAPSSPAEEAGLETTPPRTVTGGAATSQRSSGGLFSRFLGQKS